MSKQYWWDYVEEILDELQDTEVARCGSQSWCELFDEVASRLWTLYGASVTGDALIEALNYFGF